MLGFSIGDLVQFGVGGIFVLMMATGLIIPKWVAKSLTNQANENASRAMAAAEASAERADLIAQQNVELLTVMRTVETLVRALLPPKGLS